MSNSENQWSVNEAENAVDHALSALNQAKERNDRGELQRAQEKLDQAHLKLAQARTASTDNQDSLS